MVVTIVLYDSSFLVHLANGPDFCPDLCAFLRTVWQCRNFKKLSPKKSAEMIVAIRYCVVWLTIAAAGVALSVRWSVSSFEKP